MIDLDHVIPVFFRELDGRSAADDTGAVHEDVEAAILFQRGLDDTGDDLRIDEISLNSKAAAAKSLDFVYGFLKAGAACDDDEISAGFRQTESHAGAKTAAGACDQGRFSRKVKFVEDHVKPLSNVKAVCQYRLRCRHQHKVYGHLQSRKHRMPRIQRDLANLRLFPNGQPAFLQ